MKVSDYEALPHSPDDNVEGQVFVTDSLRNTNLGLCKRTTKHEMGDSVTYLEVSRVVEGVIVNYEVRHEKLE